MKITVVEPLGISKDMFETLRAEFETKGCDFEYYMDRNENPDIIAQRIGDANIVVISNIRLSADTMSKCPNLKMLSVAFTGLDHIDLEYCQTHNIEVFNTSGYSTVLELPMILMTCLWQYFQWIYIEEALSVKCHTT